MIHYKGVRAGPCKSVAIETWLDSQRLGEIYVGNCKPKRRLLHYCTSSSRQLLAAGTILVPRVLALCNLTRISEPSSKSFQFNAHYQQETFQASRYDMEMQFARRYDGVPSDNLVLF